MSMSWADALQPQVALTALAAFALSLGFCMALVATQHWHGRFTHDDLHGVQKTLEGEITLVSESPLAFEGGLVIDRLEFGVGAPPRRWNPMSIEAGIPIRFRVEL